MPLSWGSCFRKFASSLTLVCLILGASPAQGADAHAGEKTRTAILVNKKKNELHVARYDDGTYEIVKTYHATTGKVKGDKETEGDLKTPEGIYTFSSRLFPPSIKPKFGEMALYINYPNDYDEMAGRTGFDIMLHATNEPERLNNNYDSEGCVVVKNEEIREISKYVTVGLTPILIFNDLTEEYLNPGRNQKLKDFFMTWLHSWESETIDDYISHYHSDFSAQGKDKDEWKAYKSALNSRYATIKITAEDVTYYTHPKYSVITFTQNYESTLKNGSIGYRSRGTKILYVGEEVGKPKILSENYTGLVW